MPGEWRVLIVDDEPAARRGVRQLLAAFPAFTVVGECRDGAEALAALDALAPHVVFLDVQMPGVDGFEVIRRRTLERMPAVVFLTAFDQFAIRAFEVHAVDYLLKPVSAERFGVTMARLARRLRADTPRPRIRIVVTSSRAVVVVPLRESTGSSLKTARPVDRRPQLPASSRCASSAASADTGRRAAPPRVVPRRRE